MFEDADNFADLFRGGLPYYILITLPILIICSSNPVLASSEFNVHRMSQYDVLGTPYGKTIISFIFRVTKCPALVYVPYAIGINE